MRRRTRIGAGLVVALAGAWGLAGAVIAADQAVTIAELSFDPSSVTVTVGDSVTWSNQDGVPHTATADDGSFDTGNIAGGTTASVTFATAGTFTYICAIHRQMSGTIVVEAASGGGGGDEGGGGAAASPPATDMVTPTATATDDGWSGPLAALLATLGVAMVIGTVVFDRRSAAERARR